MAFGAKAVGIVRTGGSDTNCGGFFNPGNANFATDLAATSGTGAAPVVTSASYNFVAGDVGARVFIQSGTGYPGVLPRGTTTGYTDIGVSQHQDAGGVIFSRIKTGF